MLVDLKMLEFVCSRTECAARLQFAILESAVGLSPYDDPREHFRDCQKRLTEDEGMSYVMRRLFCYWRDTKDRDEALLLRHVFDLVPDEAFCHGVMRLREVGGSRRRAFLHFQLTLACKSVAQQ